MEFWQEQLEQLEEQGPGQKMVRDQRTPRMAKPEQTGQLAEQLAEHLACNAPQWKGKNIAKGSSQGSKKKVDEVSDGAAQLTVRRGDPFLHDCFLSSVTFVFFSFCLFEDPSEHHVWCTRHAL